MKIALGADHAGYEYKTEIKHWLVGHGFEVVDFGTDSAESCDYPDFAFAVAMDVAGGDSDYGIVICGTGIGVSITANKVEGIRAADCTSVEMAKLAREHNNANVLALGARIISIDLAKEISTTFLLTSFAGGRHQMRINKIHDLTGR